MKFWKMNGTGNDFIILNSMEEHVGEFGMPFLAQKLCERHMSVGADGLIVVDKSEIPGVDFKMHFYNSDGSKGELCGNGSRCICRYGYENGLSGEKQVIETTAGIIKGERINERNYRIKLTDPSLIELNKELKLENRTVKADYLVLGDPGIPHLVVDYKSEIAGTKIQKYGTEVYPEHLKDAPEESLKKLGQKLRFHPDLPKGANVNFAEITGEDTIFERTFERGVEDFTYACGTGTGSTVSAWTLKQIVSGTNVRVDVQGGVLFSDVEEDDMDTAGNVGIHGLYITGPTNIVCKGEITDEEL